MKRRRRRKIVAIVVLALLLALLGGWFWNYQRTKSLAVTFAPTNKDLVPAPTFLFSFSGNQANRLLQPIGLAVTGNNVYVVDGMMNLIFEFDTTGRFIRTFGTGKVNRPVYCAINPKNGNLYVSDRGKKQVLIFTPDGRYVGVFDPHLPKDQLPKFDTKGKEWDPIALTFAPDGSLYVTEVLNGHRVLQFTPDGKFAHSVGTAGFVKSSSDAPTVFQFPNGIAYDNGLVYVADSNNRRVQVFDKNLNYKSLIVTGGLPRGIAFLNKTGVIRGTDKFVISDTLSHDGSIYSIKGGDKLVGFGEQGNLDGQFQFPDEVGIDSHNQIFIADSENSRVQVWGWPGTVLPAPPLVVRQYWPLCLTPLLLLPLLLLRRKRKYVATRDFVLEMVRRDDADKMPGKRRKWLVMPWDYEALKDISQGDVHMADLLEEVEYSESDARELKQRLEISDEQAALLSVAQRAYIFCNEDPEVRRLAKLLDIDTVDCTEFVERFAQKQAAEAARQEE